MNRALTTASSGASAAVIVTWAWNAMVIEPAITPEVAAVIGSFLAPIADIAVAARDRIVRATAGEPPPNETG